MSSTRKDFTPTNYDVKLTSERPGISLNIGEIRQVNAGDTVTIFNDSEGSATFTDSDGLWGRIGGIIVLSPGTSGRVPVIGRESEPHYEIVATILLTDDTPDDAIALKIKMGGGGWKIKPRAHHK